MWNHSLVVVHSYSISRIKAHKQKISFLLLSIVRRYYQISESDDLEQRTFSASSVSNVWSCRKRVIFLSSRPECELMNYIPKMSNLFVRFQKMNKFMLLSSFAKQLKKKFQKICSIVFKFSPRSTLVMSENWTVSWTLNKQKTQKFVWRKPMTLYISIQSCRQCSTFKFNSNIQTIA